MPYISKDFIKNKLMPNLDIVQVLQQYISLKKQGANYTCCCPFHNEKTPSFMVNPTRQFFYCFGCQEHGTVVDFVMKYKNETFPEAVEELSRFAGIEVEYDESSHPRSNNNSELKKPYYELLDRVAAYFSKELYQHQEALDYFSKQRQLSSDTISKARLGFAPKDFYSIQKAVIKNETEAKILCELGVVKENPNGDANHRYRSFFIERVIFPIFDVKGRIIGFGGRIIKGDGPKYLNSAESSIFQKRQELFGLYECLQATRNRPASIVMVEGYLDVIALRQAGFTNVVATLGTASNSDHFRLLFRYTDKVICCYDGDAAGQKAAWKALQAAAPVLPEDKEVCFATLPEGHDPDSLVRSEGKESFEAVLNSSTGFIECIVQHCSNENDVTSIDGLRRFLNAATSIAKTLSPSRQLSIFKLLREISGFDREELNAFMSNVVADTNFVRDEDRALAYGGSGQGEKGDKGNRVSYGAKQRQFSSTVSHHRNDSSENQSFDYNALTPYQGSFANKAYGYGAQVQNMQQAGRTQSQMVNLNQFGKHRQSAHDIIQLASNQRAPDPSLFKDNSQQGTANAPASGQQLWQQQQPMPPQMQPWQPMPQNMRSVPNQYNNQNQGQGFNQGKMGPNNMDPGDAQFQGSRMPQGAMQQGRPMGPQGNQQHNFNNMQQGQMQGGGQMGQQMPRLQEQPIGQDQSMGQIPQGQIQAPMGQVNAPQMASMSFPEIKGRLIEVNPSSNKPVPAGDISNRAFLSSLTDDERFTYFTMVGREYNPEIDLNSSVYHLMAFILQEPSIVVMCGHMFQYDFFLAVCQSFRVPEYPCLDRLFALILATPDPTTAKIMEEFRDTEFYVLFKDLLQVKILGRYHDDLDNLSSRDLMLLERHLMLQVINDALYRRLKQLHNDPKMPRYKELEANLVNAVMRFMLLDLRFDQEVSIELRNKLTNKLTEIIDMVREDIGHNSYLDGGSLTRPAAPMSQQQGELSLVQGSVTQSQVPQGQDPMPQGNQQEPQSIPQEQPRQQQGGQGVPRAPMQPMQGQVRPVQGQARPNPTHAPKEQNKVRHGQGQAPNQANMNSNQ